MGDGLKNTYTNRVCACGPCEEEPKTEGKIIDVTVAVFFDGTCNNKYNINAPNDGVAIPSKKNSSYYGTFTNVVELYESYDEYATPNTAKVYVEGIGTIEPVKNAAGKLVSSGEMDNQSGYAFGKGNTGINGKIERGCRMIADEIIEMQIKNPDKNKKITTLTLDVFGFSRGAAAARSFVNRIDKTPEDGITDADLMLAIAAHTSYTPEMSPGVMEAAHKLISEGKMVNLRRYLEDRNIMVEEIVVRFLGIFDTVSSYAPGSFVDLNFNNDVTELGLNIPSEVKKVVHLVAADEYRHNFAVTSITPSREDGIELILPGAHSDIGGGYNEIEYERIAMNGPYDLDRCRGYMKYEELKAGSWIPPNCDHQELDIYGDSHTVITMTHREIKNTYSKIPLNLMGKLSEKSGIIYKKVIYNKAVCISEQYRFEIYSAKDLIDRMISGRNILYELREAKEKKYCGLVLTARSIITPICSKDKMNIIKSIRTNYIHLSCHNEKAVLDTFIEPHKPAKDRIRLVLHS